MYGPQQTMRIVNLADGTCDAPDPQKTFSIYQAQYAPAGDRLWWVSANDPQEQSFTLWLADGNGASPVAVATEPNLGGAFSGDGKRLYISHNGESSAALGWADVTASPPVENILSSNRGDIGLLGNNRVLFLDHYNVQDGSGELVFVDLATGARQSLARAVTGVTVSGSSRRGRGRRLYRSRPGSFVARRLVADDTAALSARVLVCALVLLAAGRAHGQAALPDGGAIAEPAVEPSADASAGRDGAERRRGGWACARCRRRCRSRGRDAGQGGQCATDGRDGPPPGCRRPRCAGPCWRAAGAGGSRARRSSSTASPWPRPTKRDGSAVDGRPGTPPPAGGRVAVSGR